MPLVDRCRWAMSPTARGSARSIWSSFSLNSGVQIWSRAPAGRGGYTLSREPDDIWIAEIVQAVDEPLQVTRCQGDAIDGCVNGEKCVTHELGGARPPDPGLPSRSPWATWSIAAISRSRPRCAGQWPIRSNNGVNPLGQYAHISTTCVEPAPAESSAGDDCRPRCSGNASSVHGEGRGARDLVEAAREIAAAFAVPPRSVVFSGGTEANALALRGIAADRIIISAVEHPSIHAAAGQSGRLIEHLPVDGCGIVALTALERLLSNGPENTLVSLMLANNETGAIQPVAEAARLAHARGAIVHCDAAQAVGRVAVDWHALGVDLMTLSAHKFGGPQGIGALLVKPGTPLAPLIGGGGRKFHLRGGTENVAAIAVWRGAEAGALDDAADAMAAWRDLFESRLKAVSPGCGSLPSSAIAEHQLLRARRFAGRDSGHGARSPRHCGFVRLGLLVRQGGAFARSRGDGRAGGSRQGGAQGEPRLEHHGEGSDADHRGLERARVAPGRAVHGIASMRRHNG